MRKKLLIGFAALAAVAVVAPAAGQAFGTSNFPIKRFPKVFRNGVKLNTIRRPAEAVGGITLHNGVLGNLTCQNIFAGVTYNETTEGTEKGFDNTTGYTTFNCEGQAPCRVKNTHGEEVEGNFFTAESPPVSTGTEAHVEAHFSGITSLPWNGELIERETGIRQVLTHHVKIWFASPPSSQGRGGCMGVEIPFEDAEGTTEREAGYELAPQWFNGARNGLKPSHAEFTGEEGLTEKQFPQTGRLKSPVGDGFTTGPKLITGGLEGGWELLTVE
jgi:hypothetical protein